MAIVIVNTALYQSRRCVVFADVNKIILYATIHKHKWLSFFLLFVNGVDITVTTFCNCKAKTKRHHTPFLLRGCLTDTFWRFQKNWKITLPVVCTKMFLERKKKQSKALDPFSKRQDEKHVCPPPLFPPILHELYTNFKPWSW